jgi:hypothetical protein
MQYYEYIAGDNWAASPDRGVHIKQQQNANVAGDRRSLGNVGVLMNSGKWRKVDHAPNTNEAIGEEDKLHPPHLGIMTPGQFQCMCIIVAIFETEGDRTWSKAWLTHVSSEYANEVNGMIAKLDANNHGKAYVAIGGRKSSLETMKVIKDAFGGTEVPPPPVPKVVAGARGGGNQAALAPAAAPARTAYLQPVFKPETVLIYAGGKADEPFGFGRNVDGFVGEVTGTLRWDNHLEQWMCI